VTTEGTVHLKAKLEPSRVRCSRHGEWERANSRAEGSSAQGAVMWTPTRVWNLLDFAFPISDCFRRLGVFRDVFKDIPQHLGVFACCAMSATYAVSLVLLRSTRDDNLSPLLFLMLFSHCRLSISCSCLCSGLSSRLC
jgi:hypothetical protein